MWTGLKAAALETKDGPPVHSDLRGREMDRMSQHRRLIGKDERPREEETRTDVEL